MAPRCARMTACTCSTVKGRWCGTAGRLREQRRALRVPVHAREPGCARDPRLSDHATSHAQVTGAVVGAGDFVITQGVITKLSNQSGTWHPHGNNLVTALRAFTQWGVLDDRAVKAGGIEVNQSIPARDQTNVDAGRLVPLDPEAAATCEATEAHQRGVRHGFRASRSRRPRGRHRAPLKVVGHGDPVGGIEARQVQLANRVEHGPHQVVLRHPIAHRRRHQEHLVTINPDEPRTHTAGPRPTGRTPFPDSLPGRRRPPLRDEIRSRAAPTLPRALRYPRRGLTPRRPATGVERLCRHFSKPSPPFTGQPLARSDISTRSARTPRLSHLSRHPARASELRSRGRRQSV